MANLTSSKRVKMQDLQNVDLTIDYWDDNTTTLRIGNTSLASIDGAFTPVGAHTTNSSLGGVVTLTPPATATRILLQAFSQNIRYTVDGTAPAAGTGFQLAIGGDPLLIVVTASTVLKVIQETAGASIQYQWGL